MMTSPKAPRSLRDTFIWLSLTVGGLGKAPKMPGTVGTLAALAITAFLSYVELTQWWLLGLLATGLTIWLGLLSPWIERHYGEKDPKEIVLDEVAGYFLAVVSWYPPPQQWLHLLLAFCLFRLFDITKPFPISRLEKLPGGWGIALDDLGAGVISALLLNGAYYFIGRVG